MKKGVCGYENNSNTILFAKILYIINYHSKHILKQLGGRYHITVDLFHSCNNHYEGIIIHYVMHRFSLSKIKAFVYLSSGIKKQAEFMGLDVLTELH